MTLATIQARLASTRLPGKVLYELGGRTVLEWVVRRTRAARLVDKVCVATTLCPEDKAIMRTASAIGASFSGHAPPDNVLIRFRDLGMALIPNTIVRITADCPFIDPTVIDQVVEPLLDAEGMAFSSNVYWERDESCGWPDGLDVEAFTYDALMEADRQETNPADREHVCHWMHRNLPNLYEGKAPPGLPDIRWTLDTPEDYAHLRALVTREDIPEMLTLETLLEREAAL